MALAATIVFEVRPTNGADTNSGGFKTGASGTDYSQQNSAQYALTGLTTAAANAIILTASAAADMVGNTLRITGGTNFTAGLYEITAVSVGVSITVDRNCTTAAGASGTANIGGAIQTIGQIHTIMTTSNTNTAGLTFWVKAESGYSLSAGVTLSPNSSTGNNITQVNGYTTTRGDNGRVTLTRTSNTGYTMFTTQPSSVGLILRNFVIDAATGASMIGLSALGTNCQIENWIVKNCTNGGIVLNNRDNVLIRCQITTCAGGSGAVTMESSNGPNRAIDCIAYANTNTGFAGKDFVAIRCISANNTGGSTDGFGGSMGNNTGCMILEGCVAYGNGRHGFNFASALVTPVFMENCVGYSNASKDINYAGTVTPSSITSDYNFYGTQTGYTANTHDVVLTVDPFVAGASNNFALNNTASGGAAVRGVGYPGVLGVGGTGYHDGGALQHQDPVATVVYVAPRNTTIVMVEDE